MWLVEAADVLVLVGLLDPRINPQLSFRNTSSNFVQLPSRSW